MKPIYRDIIALIRAALHDEAPNLSCMEESAWAKLLKESKRHLLSAITYAGLERSENQPNAECLEQWRIAKEKAIYQSVLMEKESEAILAALKERHIAVLPLKGYWLRNLYPKIWMRQMVDIDLLIQDGQRALVRDLMVEMGYSSERYGAGHHDVYEKKPFCCMEIHTTLFDKSEAPQFYAFFDGIDPRNGNMSADLFYLYFIVHLYHHHRQSGIGLRVLVDCYLYLRENAKQMDRAVLLQNLKELELDAFEQRIRTLAFKLFDCTSLPLDEDEQQFFDDFCQSGATGSLEVMVKRNVARLKEQDKMSKWAYFKSRVFLPYEWFEDHIPFYARHRYLIPFYHCFRFFRAVLFRRKQIKSEIQALKKES